MSNFSRRRFLLLIGTAVIGTALPGCQGLTPKPFTTGRTITPPQGCTELLKRDPQGDC